MKLITEFNDQNIEFFTEEVTEESTGAKDKAYFIEGIFAQCGKTNRNGRVYPPHVLQKAVKKYNEEQVNKNRAVGELNHPSGPTINLDKVSHKIVELRWEGDNLYGKASVLDTPNGRIVKKLLDGGVQLGVSTRGMGSLESVNGVNVVNEDFVLNTVDIVQDPSAHDAFVNGIMEGVEWTYVNGTFRPLVIEEKETEISPYEGPSYESQIREFKNFLSNVKSKHKE